MPAKKLFTCTLILCILILSGNKTKAVDSEFWTIQKVTGQINDDWSLSITEQFNFKNRGSKLYFYFTEIGAGYAFNQHFDIKLFYRHVYHDFHLNNQWDLENRPHASFTMQVKRGIFNIADRNRISYRIFQKRDNILLYRNFLTVAFPLTLFNQNMQTRIGNEWWIDIQKPRMVSDHIYVTLMLDPYKFLRIKLNYVAVINNSGQGIWTPVHIARLGFEWNLN